VRYITSMTQKGQMTVPKQVRDELHLRTSSKVVLDFDKESRTITLEPAVDILDMVGELRPAKVVPATEIRERMERDYGTRGGK